MWTLLKNKIETWKTALAFFIIAAYVQAWDEHVDKREDDK